MRLERRSSGPGGFETLVARDMDAVESLRSDWQNLQAQEPMPNVNADIDHYISVMDTRPSKRSPYVVLLRGKEKAALLAVGRLEETREFTIRLGYKTLLRPALRCLVIVHGGVTGSLEPYAIERLFDEIDGVLRRREADAVFLNHFPVDSPVTIAARRAAGVLRRAHFTVCEPHWTMPVPRTMEEVYKSLSKKTRSNLRRSRRILERTFPGRLEHVCHSAAESLHEVLESVQEVASKTYQYGMGAGYLGTVGERRHLENLARFGWLRIHLLRVEGSPVAFEIIVEYERRCFLYATGYDPAFSAVSPGKVLLLMVLEDLCRRQEVDVVDFGFGDAPYKRWYCTGSVLETCPVIFAPRLKPMTVNALLTTCCGVSLAVAGALRATGATAWVKRRWRDRLSSHSIGKAGGSQEE